MDVVAKFYGTVSYTDGSQSSFGVYLNEDGTIVTPDETEDKKVIASLYRDKNSDFMGALAPLATFTVTPPTKTDSRTISSFDFNFSGLIDQSGTIQSWEVSYDGGLGIPLISSTSRATFIAALADNTTKTKLQNLVKKLFDGVVTLA